MRWTVLAMVIAAIAHLTVVLSVPSRPDLGPGARFAALGTSSLLATIPGPPPGTLPYLDPAMATAACRFDLQTGGVTIRLPVTPVDFAILSVHDRLGAVLYALTNRSAVNGTLSVTIDRGEGDDPSPERNSGAIVIHTANAAGFAMASVLVGLPSQRPGAETAARRLVCEAAPKEIAPAP